VELREKGDRAQSPVNCKNVDWVDKDLMKNFYISNYGDVGF
jgi:hypothetical protein